MQVTDERQRNGRLLEYNLLRDLALVKFLDFAPLAYRAFVNLALVKRFARRYTVYARRVVTGRAFALFSDSATLPIGAFPDTRQPYRRSASTRFVTRAR
jgi:hypothetical protein